MVATLGLTGALAIPIVAQGTQERHGNIPVAIDAIGDPSFFTGDVVVDEFAPLAVFAGSGKKVAIDGRPVGMLEGASAQEEAAGGADDNDNDTLLAGQVGELGVLPGDLQLMHPVTTRRISSAYGWRKNPTGPGNQVHIGQDYALACGSPVYAAETGRVIVSGWHGHSGNRVTLDHGNNVQTGYSHNTKLLVKIGDEVEQGELIALVGTTGNSTGCHLHFEVIIDGRWHDPRNYLPVIPGQPNAMVDSRRLTVKSNSPPGGNGGNHSNSPQPSQDPDVVTPKDDTPTVPKPSKSPKPSPSKSPSPSPSETAPGQPTPSTSPTKPTPGVDSPDPSPTSPEPSENSPSPSQDPSASPTEDSGEPGQDGSPETSVPPQSTSGSPSPAGSPSTSPSGSGNGAETADPTGTVDAVDPTSASAATRGPQRSPDAAARVS